MKYITGTHNREYHINGIVIPKARYKPEERERGKREVLPLDDGTWEKLQSNRIIQELLHTHLIRVTDKAPISQYQEMSSLQEALKASEEERKRIETEAIETIQELQERIKRLEAGEEIEE